VFGPDDRGQYQGGEAAEALREKVARALALEDAYPKAGDAVKGVLIEDDSDDPEWLTDSVKYWRRFADAALTAVRSSGSAAQNQEERFWCPECGACEIHHDWCEAFPGKPVRAGNRRPPQDEDHEAGIEWVLISASDDEVGPACMNVPVPETIRMDDDFREAYVQGFRHALADVRAYLSRCPSPERDTKKES